MGREAREKERRRFQRRLNGNDGAHLLTGAPAAGDPVVLDAFGRELRPGDGVLVPTIPGVVWTVEELHRVLDPRAPAGTIIAALSAQMPAHLQERQRNSLMLVIPHEQAEEAAGTGTAGAQPPAEAPRDGDGEGDRHDATTEPPAAPPGRIVGLDGRPVAREE